MFLNLSKVRKTTLKLSSKRFTVLALTLRSMIQLRFYIWSKIQESWLMHFHLVIWLLQPCLLKALPFPH